KLEIAGQRADLATELVAGTVRKAVMSDRPVVVDHAIAGQRHTHGPVDIVENSPLRDRLKQLAPADADGPGDAYLRTDGAFLTTQPFLEAPVQADACHRAPGRGNVEVAG